MAERLRVDVAHRASTHDETVAWGGWVHYATGQKPNLSSGYSWSLRTPQGAQYLKPCFIDMCLGTGPSLQPDDILI